MTRFIRSSMLLLALSLLFAATGLAQQNFSAARSAFKRSIRSDSLSDRRAAVRTMRNTKDTRAIQEMLTQLHKARKEAAKLEKKTRPILKKLGKARGDFDKRLNDYLAQNPGTSTYPAGLVGNLPQKIDELTQKLAPLDRELRIENSTREMLKTAIGDLITSLDEAAQLEATNLFISQYERLRKPEQKALYLEILGYIHNPQAVIGLVGIAANAPEAASRVAALKALERLGDYRGGKAAKFALEDEHWNVRATAIEAARSFASVDMIPALIKRLEVEQGRLRGDIIETLSLLAGVSYSENVILWKKWWKENEKELRDIVKNLKSKEATDQVIALQKMEAHGFLLAARRVLEKRGLTAAQARAEESRRLVDPESVQEGKLKGDDEEDSELAAVGKTLAERPKEIRELAVDTLIFDAFSQTWSKSKRHELIRLMGHIGGKQIAQVLARLVKKPDSSASDDWNRMTRRRERQGRLTRKWRSTENERIPAIKALAQCATGTPLEMRVLREVTRDEANNVEMMLAAVRAYESIDSKQSVKALIEALGEIASASDERKNKMAGVAKAIADSLRKMTKQELGDTHDAWVTWWSTAEPGFKTESEKEAEKNPAAAKNKDEEGGTSFYGIKTYSKRIVFILDISGSMSEPAEYSGKTKIEVAKEELTRAIASLPKDAKFNIIFYSTDYKVWQKKLVPAEAKIKKAAKVYIAEQQAAGGTNIYEPLVKVFDIAGRGSKDKGYSEIALDTIFFLSDGQPTAGRITNPEDIMSKVFEMNSLRRIKIHTIGVGRGHDRGFMQALADKSGGKYVAK